MPCDNLDTNLRRALGWWARKVYDHPFCVIFFIMLFSALCLTGITVQVKDTNLIHRYSPQNSRTMEVSSYVHQEFGYSPYAIAIIAIPKDSSTNVLELDNILVFEDVILNYILEIKTPDNITIENACFFPYNTSDDCAMHSILNHWGYDKRFLDSVSQEEVY
jgi:acetyltransferase-like isoleucine patch superfamily enzyme